MSIDQVFSFKEKTILIVGASSGIGRHAALLFAERNANLILAARRKPQLDNLASEINAKSFYVDVTQPETISDLLSHTGKIDVLLNTTGINIRKPALDHTDDDWDRLMNINLKGTWTLNQAIIKHMILHKTKGKIINLSSIYGSVTAQDYALYAISKAGIEHLTRSLALESAKHGIQVNAIAPGYIETELNRDYLKNVIKGTVIERTPLGRLGSLNDLDGVLLLLASHASDYITGTIINVDGGCSAHRFL